MMALLSSMLSYVEYKVAHVVKREYVCLFCCLFVFFFQDFAFFLSRLKSPIRFAFRSIAPGEKKLKVQQLYIEIVSRECRAFVHSVHTHRLYII